jgi:hypothetical protein
VVAVALQVVRYHGLLAISDDDYARVVIAQEFAAHPSWDPSGTSWLPLPFWVVGTALKVGAATLSQARLVTGVFNAACCAVLCLLGHHLGLGRVQAALVTLATALLPSALWLGAAPIPEFSSAILVTVSCLSLLAPRSSWWRVVGACTSALACASRYETWPVAAGVLACNALDIPETWRERRVHGGRLMLACLVTLAFPLVWMLHGRLQHGEALFFLGRVSKYRLAIGHGLPTWRELIAGYPRALLATEPLVLPLGLSALVLALRHRPLDPAAATFLRRGATRVVGLLVLQVVILVLGEARGGAPTHHPERALLAVWTTLSFLAGYVWCTRGADIPRRSVASACTLYLLASHLMAPWGARLAESRLRAPEEEMGHKLALSPSATVGLATHDYGYFAIMAAAGGPGRFEIWSRHDPRVQHAPAPLPFWLREHAIQRLVAPHDMVVEHPSSAPPALVARHRVGHLVLYDVAH